MISNEFLVFLLNGASQPTLDLVINDGLGKLNIAEISLCRLVE